jgi:hypothetical protein
MNTFEDKLLAELRTVVAERPADIRRKRPKRLLVGIAACLTLAAGTAVAVPMLGGEHTTSPAYAVVTQPDGTVRVTIYRVEDDKGLEKRLRAAGIPAVVDFVPKGKFCRRTPSGESSGFRVQIGWLNDRQTGQIGTLVLRPADYRRYGATQLIEGEGFGPRDRVLFAAPKTGSFGPCVPTDMPKQR